MNHITQGLKANVSGSSFEQKLYSAFMKTPRYQVVSSRVNPKTQRINELVLQLNDKKIKINEQYVFRDIYNNKSKMDFIININDDKYIFVECKYQQSEGSVSSKIPYSCALLNGLSDTNNFCVYLSGGKIFEKPKVNNIMNYMKNEYPNLTFIHVIDDDYDELFDYVETIQN